MWVRHSDCQFEWFSREGEARKAGLSEQTIETLRHGGHSFAAPDEQAIHDYASELLRDHRATGERPPHPRRIRHRPHRRTDPR